jgi:hypothetical protein
LKNTEEIDTLQKQLNDLVSAEDIELSEGEVLYISQKLDKLVNMYYSETIQQKME